MSSSLLGDYEPVQTPLLTKQPTSKTTLTNVTPMPVYDTFDYDSYFETETERKASGSQSPRKKVEEMPYKKFGSIYYKWLPSLKGFMVAFLFVTLIPLFAVLVAAIISRWEPSITFCDTGKEGYIDGIKRDCLRCPEHARCVGGQLVDCQPHYIRRGNFCVLEESVEQLAARIEFVIHRHLALQRGKESCGEKVKIALTTEEVEEVAVHEVYNNLDPKEKMKWGKAMEHFMNQAKQNRLADIKYKLDTLQSDTAIKPWECILKQWYNQHTIEIYGVFTLIIVMGVLLYRRRVAKRVQDLTNQVLECLSEKCNLSKNQPPIAVDSFRTMFGVKSNDIWDRVVENISMHGDVQKSERQFGGVQKVAWAWSCPHPYKSPSK